MFRTRISAVAAFLCALQFMLWGLIVHTHNQKDNSEATDVSFNRTFDHPYLKLTGDKAKGTTTHVRGSEICDINIQHSSHNPLIAIALATTSRHMSERINDPAKRRTELLRKNQHISSTVADINSNVTKSSSLFRILLPSLARTLDCGFRYLIVVGYDIGDRFYDTPAGQSEVKIWFEANVASPQRSRNVDVSLVLSSCNNTLRKPGPAFTVVTREAFGHNADYIYRVNDDTEFMSPWATEFVLALHQMAPPYGVVGPLVCNKGGNTRILTHDFTHRTHMEIFQQWYYPPELADWWMDAWISRVYGSSRTRLLTEVLIGHRTKEHGRRYTVDHMNKRSLEALVEIGRSQIVSFMRANFIPLGIITNLLKDDLDGRSADLVTALQAQNRSESMARSC